MEKIKKYWKEILIAVLAVLFVSNCTGKGNYHRKYDKQVERTDFVLDSMNSVYGNSAKYIDSLEQVIKLRDNEIAALNNEISIYKDQNSKLANKPVIVRVNHE